MPQKPEVSPVVLDAVLERELQRALSQVRYGTVELVIHDGRVVQIERRERFRLSEAGAVRK